MLVKVLAWFAAQGRHLHDDGASPEPQERDHNTSIGSTYLNPLSRRASPWWGQRAQSVTPLIHPSVRAFLAERHVHTVADGLSAAPLTLPRRPLLQRLGPVRDDLALGSMRAHERLRWI